MFRFAFMSMTTIFALVFLTTTIASAEDNWVYMPVKDALQSDLAKDKLDSGISFFMKGQSHPRTSNETREYTANKRARKFGRSEEEACHYAFVSALLSFQQRANKEGRNAAIDLYSVTKDKKFESSDQYSCLVGGMVANVALRGKVANIGK